MRVSENEEDKHTTDDYWLKLAGMKFETGATDHCRLDQEYNLVNICKWSLAVHTCSVHRIMQLHNYITIQ